MCPCYSACRRASHNMTTCLELPLSGQPPPPPPLHLIISGHDWPCPGLCVATDPASLVSKHRVQPLQGLADAALGRLAWHIRCVSPGPYGHQHPQPALLARPLQPNHLLLPSSLSLLLWSPPLLPSSHFHHHPPGFFFFPPHISESFLVMSGIQTCVYRRQRERDTEKER